MKKDKLGAKLRAIFLTKDEEDTLQKIAKAKSLAILNLIFGRLSPNTEKALLEMAVCLWKQNPPKANYCRLYLWWR